VRSAGDEDKGRVRARRARQAGSLIVDQQAPIETLAERDAAAGIGAAVGAAGNLDEGGAKADGVVPGHHPRVPAGEAIGEIARRAAPGRHRLARGLGEAAVVVRDRRAGRLPRPRPW
jgi:hypothetical protein